MDDKITPAAAATTDIGVDPHGNSSAISDDPAKSAYGSMTGNIRRSSSGVTDDAAEAARDFVRSAQAQGTRPGLSDDIVSKAHKFLDGTATHRTSHSKHLPDVTLPGVTDQIAEEALEFEESIEKSGR